MGNIWGNHVSQKSNFLKCLGEHGFPQNVGWLRGAQLDNKRYTV